MINKLSMEWLGINSFRFCYNGKTILLDPWVTRNITKVCDREIVAKYISEADYVFKRLLKRIASGLTFKLLNRKFASYFQK